MRYTFSDPRTKALFRLHEGEPHLGRDVFRDPEESTYTVIWNRGPYPRSFTADGQTLELAPKEVLALTSNQTFQFSPADTLVAFQFNQEFYCIVDHDREVSCVGLLFYGTSSIPIVGLDEEETRRFQVLLDVFIDEFREADNLQGEMLRMLLKRLIVKVTRLYKRQSANSDLPAADLDVIRQFCLLVELHFRSLHQVQDYAELLHRSPKTLANLFGSHAQQTPLQVIHDRVLLEAKRLLLYSESTAAEIAYAIGFNEPAHFSRFFKRRVGESPVAFRQNYRMSSEPV